MAWGALIGAVGSIAGSVIGSKKSKGAEGGGQAKEAEKAKKAEKKRKKQEKKEAKKAEKLSLSPEAARPGGPAAAGLGLQAQSLIPGLQDSFGPPPQGPLQ